MTLFIEVTTARQNKRKTGFPFVLFSFIRTSDFVEDTLARQYKTKKITLLFLYCSRLFVPLHSQTRHLII